MKQLAMALFAEGSADHQFIRIVAQRTAERILNQYSSMLVDVLDPHIVERSQGRQASKILDAAYASYGFHLLLVHADADARTRDAALADRIEPGRQLVLLASKDGEKVCDSVVPVIPIQMTEAWMMADSDALIAVIGTQASQTDLELPSRPLQVESLADPKLKLRDVLGIAQSRRPRRRRRELKISDLYEPLARMVRLDRLKLVPAYLRFHEDLTQALMGKSFFADQIAESVNSNTSNHAN